MTPLSTLDYLPTISSLLGIALPNIPFDGIDAGPILWGQKRCEQSRAQECQEECGQHRSYLEKFLQCCRRSHSGADYQTASTFDPVTPFQEPGGWAI